MQHDKSSVCSLIWAAEKVHCNLSNALSTPLCGEPTTIFGELTLNIMSQGHQISFSATSHVNELHCIDLRAGVWQAESDLCIFKMCLDFGTDQLPKYSTSGTRKPFCAFPIENNVSFSLALPPVSGSPCFSHASLHVVLLVLAKWRIAAAMTRKARGVTRTLSNQRA